MPFNEYGLLKVNIMYITKSDTFFPAQLQFSMLKEMNCLGEKRKSNNNNKTTKNELSTKEQQYAHTHTKCLIHETRK